MENTIAITCHRINTDTICAISTPIGEGGIGIVRISGENSLSIAQNIFLKKVLLKLMPLIYLLSQHTMDT